jgi:uncharacterized protein YutE (UPF0331/DUF86 family)
MNKTKNNDIEGILDQFDSFRKKLIIQKKGLFKDERFALIIVHAIIVSMLDFLLIRTCKCGDDFSKSNPTFMDKVTKLNESQVIDDQMLKYLKIVNKLRNEFAHRLVFGYKQREKLFLEKNDPCYKDFLKMRSSVELNNFTERLIFVWWRLNEFGKGDFLKEHFDKFVSELKKKE